MAVKFSNTNSADNPTLNVNGTGDKNIFINGSRITTNSGAKGRLTGAPIFVYDGTQWHLIGNYYDSNSNSWRAVNVNGTQLLGTGTGTGAVNFKSGTNTTVSGSGNDITINATDTVTTATTSGSGNAVTAITASSGALTVTKGATFLTGHQTIKQDGVTGATINRFGTCGTGASTAAKTVSITTGTFSLEAGSMVAVKFSNANTAGTPTLNVGSTGAKNIFVNGAQITTGGNKGLLTGTVIFIYDGTQYHIIGNYIDTNTQTVTGVKGNSESTYRTGNVNLTAANIGAAAASHTHSYAGSASAGGPATSVAVTTTAPTAANTDGLKIAYLTSEPTTKYSGWLYLIAES